MVKLKEELILDANLIQETKTLLFSQVKKSETKNHSHYRKPICPYISSTFLDLEEEFKYLHLDAFPKLNELSQAHGTYFNALDFRRTAVENRSSSSDVILKHALNNVYSSIPFFMCIIGQQYGPHRPSGSPLLSNETNLSSQQNLSVMDQNIIAASHDHPWVITEAFHLCSMIELEILLACFIGDNDVPKSCFFYFKNCYEPSNISENETFYEFESDYAQDRLNDLKRRIVNKGLPVKFFSSKEELGQAVYNDWSEVILNSFSSLPRDFRQEDELFSQLWSQHAVSHRLHPKYYRYNELEIIEAKLTRHALTSTSELPHTCAIKAQRSNNVDRLYIREDESVNGYKVGDGIFSTTTSFIESLQTSQIHVKPKQVKNIFAVIGNPGSGKTSVLSNWLHDFKKEYPHVLVISEFVGQSCLSLDVSSFMRRCIRTLREGFFQTKCTMNEILSDLQSYDVLLEAFACSLQLQPSVIVLDSANELQDAMGQDIGCIKDLSWIPKDLPKFCRIIISSRKSDLSYKALQNRPDAYIYWMPNIDLSIREKIFENHFKSDVAYFLGRDLLEKIWTNRLSEQPLFLVVLSDLLRACRNSREINQVIDKCTALRNFREFWKTIFLLWSRRYSWTKNSSGQPGSIRYRPQAAGWVADALKLIVSSRCGLYKDEIVHLLFLVGYHGRSTVTPSDWDMFREAAGSALITGHDGLIGLAHQNAKLVVKDSLLTIGKSQRTGGPGETKLQHFHVLLGTYFYKYGSLKRKLVELPWQLQQAGDWLMLGQLLCKPRFFMAMVEESHQNPLIYLDHLAYWRDLIKRDFDVNHCLKIMVEKATKDSPVQLVDHHDELRKNASSHDNNLKQKQMFQAGNLLSVGPSVIIVTQHEEPSPSLQKSNEDSKSETEEKEFSETDSSTFFLTETDVEHHLTIGGWKPGEGIVENTVDSSLLNDEEMADIYQKIAWFLFKLGGDFKRDGKNAIEDAHYYLENARPLTTTQQLSLFNLTVTGCRNDAITDVATLQKAIDCYHNLPLEIMGLSISKRRDLREAEGELSFRVVQYIISHSTHFEEAHNRILEMFAGSKKCDSVWVKALALHAYGKLLMSRGLLSQSEDILVRAFKMLVMWNGRKHVAAGRVLHDLGILFSSYQPSTGESRRKAMLAYKQALEVLEFHKQHIEAARVSCKIGRLLLEEGSMRSKKEALTCIEQAIDLFITKQATNKKDVDEVTRLFKQVSGDLREGKYAQGPAKLPDTRTSERPYSALSWHHQQLNKLKACGSSSSMWGEDEKKDRFSWKAAASLNRSRPYSAYSTHSVGKHVLITPRTLQKKTRLETYRYKEPKWDARREPIVRQISVKSTEHIPIEQSSSIKNQAKKSGDELVTDPTINVVTTVVKKRPDTSEGKEHPVIIVPGDKSKKLSIKIDSTGDEHPTTSHAIVRSQTADLARSEVSTPKRSVRLAASPVVFNKERKTPHRHRCDYPSGPQYLSMNVHGPHSAITDVLTSPPSSRISSARSVDVYHKSAWYHVPGRYPKPGQPLPSKRMQFPKPSASGNETPISRYYSSPTPVSRSLPTSRQGKREKRCVYPSAASSGISPRFVLRRHSEPHLHNPVKVSFEYHDNDEDDAQEYTDQLTTAEPLLNQS